MPSAPKTFFDLREWRGEVNDWGNTKNDGNGITGMKEALESTFPDAWATARSVVVTRELDWFRRFDERDEAFVNKLREIFEPDISSEPRPSWAYEEYGVGWAHFELCDSDLEAEEENFSVEAAVCEIARKPSRFSKEDFCKLKAYVEELQATTGQLADGKTLHS